MSLNAGHVPDILDTIANLSSDEVFTPPALANSILDLLPKEVWENPNLKFLDPSIKSGVFLREAAKRLMDGLQVSIPDEAARREHIFKSMLFGFPITELTALMSRRSVYYSKDASGPNAVVEFESDQGNIVYRRFEHSFTKGKCTICGASKENIDRGSERENYAYQFIHDQEVKNMHFDVVIGNPPYQLTDGGGGKGSSASPIYQLFVNQALRLKPRYVAMIIPARWFSGGKGLDSFRAQMLASKHFTDLVYYPDSAEVFPGPDFGGGVCYFLWDTEYEGKARFKTIQAGEIVSETLRNLDEDGAVLVPHESARPILKKIQSHKLTGFDSWVSSSKPFGIRSNFKGFLSGPSNGAYEILMSDGIKFVAKGTISAGHEYVSKYKVLVGKAYGERGNFPYKILASPRIIGPDVVCSETYLIAGSFDSLAEAENLVSYIETRFFRFLLSLQKNTQNITKEKFSFIPQLPMDRSWSDEDLYKMFEITNEEIAYIESMVRPMDKAD